jgi:hypothetical protein
MQHHLPACSKSREMTLTLDEARFLKAVGMMNLPARKTRQAVIIALQQPHVNCRQDERRNQNDMHWRPNDIHRQECREQVTLRENAPCQVPPGREPSQSEVPKAKLDAVTTPALLLGGHPPHAAISTLLRTPQRQSGKGGRLVISISGGLPLRTPSRC